MTLDVVRLVHFALSVLGLLGSFAAMAAWLAFVSRPYARQLHARTGEAGALDCVDVETTLRSAAAAGDARAQRLMRVLGRLTQSSVLFAVLFAAFAVWR